MSDVGEQARVVRHGDNGLVVPPGDPAALAAVLERLADPALRRSLGEAARRYAVDRLSWRRVGRALQQFLAGVCADRGAAAVSEGIP